MEIIFRLYSLLHTSTILPKHVKFGHLGRRSVDYHIVLTRQHVAKVSLSGTTGEVHPYGWLAVMVELFWRWINGSFLGSFGFVSMVNGDFSTWLFSQHTQRLFQQKIHHSMKSSHKSLLFSEFLKHPPI